MRSLAIVLLVASTAAADTKVPQAGKAGDWDVEVYVGDQPNTGMYDFSFQFRHGADELVIGVENGFEWGQHNFAFSPYDGKLPWREEILAELGHYLRTPEAFRDQALQRQTDLRRVVQTQIDHKVLTTCGADEHARIPLRFESKAGGPEGAFEDCVHHPMSAADQAAMLAAFRTEMTRREKLINANYKAWYATIKQLLAWPVHPVTLHPGMP